MRVQTEEWQRFIPGIRMYKGKMTLFYNGEILYDGRRFRIYNREERRSWEVIIALPGVEMIPEDTFQYCKNVKVVIMSDTVRRIEGNAFCCCGSLEFVRLSRNLEFIGWYAFQRCECLTSIFIPPSCRGIGYFAFWGCEKLIIIHVSQDTTLGANVIAGTALIKASPFALVSFFKLDHAKVNQWIKNINGSEEYALHRACPTYNPSEDAIYEILMQQGPPSLHNKNQIGITPYRYTQENPFVDFHIDEQKLVNRFVLGMMGEIVS